MKALGKAAILVAVLATIAGTVYMHDQAHRFDVVAAGSGGGQAETGSIDAYVVDHKTGRIWYVANLIAIPVTRLSCEQYSGGAETERGCSEPTGAKK